LLFGTRDAHAQVPYKSAVGLVFDGYGGSNVGLQYKMARGESTALQAQISFRSNWFSVGADYLYQTAFPEVEGLSWYVGGGVHLGFWSVPGVDMGFVSVPGTSGTNVGLRPLGGLEYKISTVPFAVHLDYRPYIGISGGTGFDAGGFSVGVKYTMF